MKNNLKDLGKLIEYLESLRIPVMIKNMSKLSEGEKAYNNYRESLDKCLEKVQDLASYTDENFARICRIILGPFNQYTMETYYELVSTRLKLKGIAITTELFYEYIKKIP